MKSQSNNQKEQSMLELLILVILVAIFFGISLTAALHGILQVGAVIVVAFLSLAAIGWAIEIYQNRPKRTPKTTPSKAKKAELTGEQRIVLKRFWLLVVGYALIVLFVIAGPYILATPWAWGSLVALGLILFIIRIIKKRAKH